MTANRVADLGVGDAESRAAGIWDMTEAGNNHVQIADAGGVENRQERMLLELLRTAALARRPMAKLVEGRGISLAQYNVMRILRAEGDQGLPTLAIRERMIEEAAGITRLIDKLESAGFVRRERSNSDRRQVVCRLQPPGYDLLAELEDGMRAATAIPLAMFTDEDLNQLSTLLARVRRNLQGGDSENGTDESGNGE